MDRRKFIASAGGLILSGKAAKSFGHLAPMAANSLCAKTTRLTPGPFHVPGSLRRSDIRDGAEGMLLDLEFTIVDSISCKPVRGAAVDVWHCDAKGLYSGVDNTVADDEILDAPHRIINTHGKTFLRGYQITDDAGTVPFKTVYPGWYVPRLTHIHVKVTSREIPNATLDTQLYFPPEVEVAVFQTEPYAARGPNPIGVEEDIVMKGDADGVKKLTLAVDVTDAGLLGRFQLALTKFEF